MGALSSDGSHDQTFSSQEGPVRYNPMFDPEDVAYSVASWRRGMGRTKVFIPKQIASECVKDGARFQTMM